jgi:methylenetetrahydrofolate reductase (NADPH)
MTSRSFASRFSLEATKPSEQEIAALAGVVPPGTEIYLSMVPGQDLAQHAEVAALVRRNGLESVPHLPARRIESESALRDFLTRVRDSAEVRRVLVVAGDVEPKGSFEDALALIRSGLLQKAGITEIGVAGYPEGHPKIPAGKIAMALHDKIAEAEKSGLRLHITSQFSFAPDKIVAWIRQLRAQGIVLPVKVGMAGPTGITALLRYAKRCGVSASLTGLMSGAAKNLTMGLLGNVGPDKIIDALDAAEGLGDTRAHYFSFGGVLDTARYAQAKSENSLPLIPA